MEALFLNIVARFKTWHLIYLHIVFWNTALTRKFFPAMEA